MFQRLRASRRNREIIDALYVDLVQLARQPVLYEEGGVPDTVMGRFEALSVHVFLFLRRCRGDDALRPVAQDVVDRFVADVDWSIRELGVGDPSVPKRMRKLAGMFYERVRTYDTALDEETGRGLLAEALRRRAVAPDAPEGAPAHLAAYMRKTSRRLAAVPAEAILAGRLQTGEEA
jgi:cytochrome b pre-mRNA-processing protein 3